ncbi:MAG: thiamine pyrophosphate-dependent dehydrogenase E1 component subunit alpha [Rhodospirillaceae bacterium]|jgi:acetoin:2,6-dichlorophenolindophenol oxidoreductase subunit alpha|nr:thiamine pyrophosphate-dependent dehydrogenase E1 component subunit alpha [Rhodospirillaceae bacterium]
MAIPKEKLLEMYRNLLTARRLDERLYAIYSEGKLPGRSRAGFTRSVGEEAIPIAVCANLRKDDYFKPNYRTLRCLFAKEGFTLTDVISGRFNSTPERGFLNWSLNLGEDIPIYTGAALSATLRKTDQVSVCAYGDGAASRGPIHEAMVVAAAWNLPVIFILQNNQYMGGTVYTKTYVVKDLSDRAKGYGFPGQTVDGNDVIATYELVKEYVDRARSGGGPGLIVANTYRLSPYFDRSPGQPSLENYRTEAEIEEHWKDEPLARYQKKLLEMGILTETDVGKFEEEIKKEIEEAAEAALALPKISYETYIKTAVAEL